jgi:hypothetical protein
MTAKEQREVLKSARSIGSSGQNLTHPRPFNPAFRCPLELGASRMAAKRLVAFP